MGETYWEWLTESLSLIQWSERGCVSILSANIVSASRVLEQQQQLDFSPSGFFTSSGPSAAIYFPGFMLPVKNIA